MLEIGTAYGLGAIYLAEALRGSKSRVYTLEISEPQIGVARSVLSPYEDTVKLVTGDREGLLRDSLRELSSVQLVFHDGEHSEAAYRSDFLAIVEHSDPGTLMLLDDIRWSDPRVDSDPRTYDGWRFIADHPRVRAAAELQSRQGLVLL